ncbi:selenoneine biosynthesis selenosugar synthase SenB [Duganella phyllosphaerae]|uniref:UDP-D-galactose:(Glucosyl)lipopolysaccharide-1, 6-D-galactosyltransferase n=1 Tax=Duganella phyllosphaerae TaxID=762836 RepID=A0A1E7W8N3_9BURK|nr:selenoneine biosynthesis selenosugar synthase SenB [Duganella phyllosphaerae]OEZ92608.1 UDP-D-galactose:(glucosyl)lipopolysaccharide-1,6-D-galactosyltransferase [Duganella phyllosphaerae]
MPRQHIWIVGPAAAGANNGNWQSASRWARFLRTRYRVTLAQQWPGASTEAPPDLLIALHARRSAPSLDAWTRAFPDRPSLLLLTGTDLYRDIAVDADAQRSLMQATALVLLQPAGRTLLPAALRAGAHVIYQSAPALKSLPAASRRHFDIAMVGHLRHEKDPLTFMRAATLVQAPAARLVHIGGVLEPELAEAAQATAAQQPRYRWLGAMEHAATRQRLKRCHAMALTSHMEGGANVIIEAVTAAVPVLASDINGNRGMLGDDYAGYFPAGDAAALARLIDRTIEQPHFYQRLRDQCAARAPLFAPAAERAALLELVDNLLNPHQGTNP